MTKQEIINQIRAGITKELQAYITKELQTEGHNIIEDDVTIQEWEIGDVKEGEVDLNLELNGVEAVATIRPDIRYPHGAIVRTLGRFDVQFRVH